MKKLKRCLAMAAAVICTAWGFLSAFGGGAARGEIAKAEDETLMDSGLDYTETTENFVNPERGFYQALAATIPSEGQGAWWTRSRFETYTKSFGLLHLRFGLEEFSSAAGGLDAPVSEDALVSLNLTLDELRKAGGTAIVRFSYNVNGTSKNGKYLENEPSPELIETHIAQLGEVLSENTDVVAGVETGMLGPWGEQHSTSLASSGDEIYYRVVESWLRAIPACRTVSVRRPLYYIYWANRKYGKALTQKNLSEDITTEGTDAYRVGVYNDGYLGSSSDLGTFADREEETRWLNAQAAHTLYGGEVVADSRTGLLGAYNDVDYLENEAFITHTSYLNIAWNDRVIAEWKKKSYDGADERYRGLTDFDYVAAHLGYRLVLRKSELSETVPRGGVLRLKGRIENVGFGNVVNRKIAQIVLHSDAESYVSNVDWDVRNALSGTTAEYDWRFRLPSGISAGKYQVYLKLRDAEEKTPSALRSIRFANEGIFEAELGGNKLGEISVSAQTDGSGDTFEQIGGGEQSAFVLSFTSEAGATGLPEGMKVVGGETVLLPQTVPVRKGYAFAGWDDGSRVYAAGEAYRVLQNVTLKASWTKEQYTVKFDGDGGSLVSGTETQKVFYKDAAAPPVYEKEGHEFAGWSSDPERIEEATTIVALWKANVYTVRFLSREEAELTEGSASQEVEYGKAALPPVYVREGYRLVGWSGDYQTVTGHGVYYALWEKTDDESKESSGCFGSVSASACTSVLLTGAALGILSKKKARR